MSSLRINGKDYSLELEARESLLDVLRQQPAFRRRNDLGAAAGLVPRSPREAAPRGAPGP